MSKFNRGDRVRVLAGSKSWEKAGHYEYEVLTVLTHRQVWGGHGIGWVNGEKNEVPQYRIVRILYGRHAESDKMVVGEERLEAI